MVISKLESDILKLVKDDPSQKEVIISDNQKILVEAPAGFGKTFTMINMIKYWIATGKIKNYEKVLCLSFSVSAANRMRENIESSFKDSYSSSNLVHHVQATNFHGICRNILSKYGFLVGLKPNVDYQNVDSTNKDELKLLPLDERAFIHNEDSEISTASISQKKLYEQLSDYNAIIRNSFLPCNKLPYNAIITLTLELLINNTQICSFYRKYYRAICIDEFQDTNILGLSLIHILSGENTKLVAFGDDMQQIYQFLGAIPSLIDKTSQNSSIQYVQLTKNYRFKNNKSMQALDSQLRFYKTNLTVTQNTKIPIDALHGTSISDESAQIISFINNHPDNKCAILFSGNSLTTKKLIEKLSEKITLFNALFKDDDKQVKHFHEKALETYLNMFKSHPISQSGVQKYINTVIKSITQDSVTDSLTELLKVFIHKSIIKYSSDIRSEVISTVLSSCSLRQNLVDINEKVTVSTIHGSKGLEWDYVILANFEYHEIPNYFEIRDIGLSNEDPRLIVNSDNSEYIRNLLNKFYVAFSRARKNFIVSYSDLHWEYSYGKPVCCKAHVSPIGYLPFIQIRNIVSKN